MVILIPKHAWICIEIDVQNLLICIKFFFKWKEFVQRYLNTPLLLRINQLTPMNLEVMCPEN